MERWKHYPIQDEWFGRVCAEGGISSRSGCLINGECVVLLGDCGWLQGGQAWDRVTFLLTFGENCCFLRFNQMWFIERGNGVSWCGLNVKAEGRDNVDHDNHQWLGEKLKKINRVWSHKFATRPLRPHFCNLYCHQHFSLIIKLSQSAYLQSFFDQSAKDVDWWSSSILMSPVISPPPPVPAFNSPRYRFRPHSPIWPKCHGRYCP